MNTATQIAEIFAAVGTLAAVVLALFLQVIIVARRRPSLSLQFSPDESQGDIVTTDWADDFNLWIQLKVHATSGRNTARNVQVMVLRVVRPSVSGTDETVPSRVLKWSDSPTVAVDIPSGTWRRVDLVRYYKAKKPKSEPALLFPAFNPQLVAQFPPSPRHHLTESGRYVFELAISADEINAIGYWVAFDFSPAPVNDTNDMKSQIANITYGAAKISDGGLLNY
jgi:hypothetical protein